MYVREAMYICEAEPGCDRHFGLAGPISPTREEDYSGQNLRIA